MKKSIVYSSILLFFAGIFFVTNDAIINYLSQTNVKFYHFIFYGIPIYLCFPFYLFIDGTLKKNIKCTNYFSPIMNRGDFYFSVSRLVPFKRVDLLVKAFFILIYTLSIDSKQNENAKRNKVD